MRLTPCSRAKSSVRFKRALPILSPRASGATAIPRTITKSSERIADTVPVTLCSSSANPERPFLQSPQNAAFRLDGRDKRFRSIKWLELLEGSYQQRGYRACIGRCRRSNQWCATIQNRFSDIHVPSHPQGGRQLGLAERILLGLLQPSPNPALHRVRGWAMHVNRKTMNK
jgi:hypothetical protein